MATSVIPLIKVTTNPTSSETTGAGYPLGQHWFNSTTGAEYIHKSDGVWVPFSVSGHTHSEYLTTTGSTATKVDTLTIKSKQLTGFETPSSVNVSYDSINKTITLSGTITAYWQGLPITELSGSTWTSTAHPIPTGTTTYYLSYNGSGFVWNTTVWAFSDLQIAFVYSDGIKFALRECHGLMDQFTHEQNHFNIGTTLRSGGDISNLIVNSTTASNRRPVISQSTVVDEDLSSTLDSLTGLTYSQFYLSGSGATISVTTGATDIIALSTNNPYYNNYTGGAWTQSLFANNTYGKIFIVAVPVTSDAESKQYRYLFIQPQTTSTTLSTIQSVSPSSVNLGKLTNMLPEFVFIGEIIVRYTSANWVITSYAKIIGNRYTQSSLPTGQYLSSVATDGTIDGNGTPSSPLSIASTLGNINTILDNINGQVI